MTTSGVLTFFSVSRSHLSNIIAGGGIMLNFLCGLKAKNAMAPRIQEKDCEIYFSVGNTLWDRDFLFTRLIRIDPIDPYETLSRSIRMIA